MTTSTHVIEPLALNAIANVALAGLLSGQPDYQASLRRDDMPEDLIKPILQERPPSSPYYAELCPRRPSTQPSPGNGQLEASLGDYIGHGHSSVVYALKDVIFSDITRSAYVPPLVVKIARLNRVTSLMREAWFYDEMECLQGVSIARCYGYFTMKIEDDTVKVEREEVERKYPNHDRREMNPVLEWDRDAGPLHQLLDDQSRRTDALAVLILEKLGTTLPLGFPVSQETRDDLDDVYTDMAHLGVTNAAGIRLPNILKAPLVPPGLPSLPSPFSGKIHSWRAIDLEHALKVNMSVKALHMDFGCQLVGIYDDVEMYEDEI